MVTDASHAWVPSSHQDSHISQPDKRPFSAYEAHNLLRKISSSDLDIMGLSEDYARPDWMILTVLPVPPPPVRPSISVDGGAMRSEDDLTYKLAEILKASIQVRTKEQEGVPPSVLEPFEQLLQVGCLTLVLASTGRRSQLTHARWFRSNTVPRRDLYGQ